MVDDRYTGDISMFPPVIYRCLHGRHFNCLGDSKCISLTKICDGRQDCKDNSDEDPVLCAKNDIQPL